MGFCFAFALCFLFGLCLFLSSHSDSSMDYVSILLSSTFGAHCRYYDVAIALIRGIEICKWLSGLLNDLAKAIWRWTEKKA